MSRPPKAVPTVRQEIYLPEPVHSRLTMLLMSPAEGRVPHGEWSRFFTQLAEAALERVNQGANDGTVR